MEEEVLNLKAQKSMSFHWNSLKKFQHEVILKVKFIENLNASLKNSYFIRVCLSISTKIACKTSENFEILSENFAISSEKIWKTSDVFEIL